MNVKCHSSDRLHLVDSPHPRRFASGVLVVLAIALYGFGSMIGSFAALGLALVVNVGTGLSHAFFDRAKGTVTIKNDAKFNPFSTTQSAILSDVTGTVVDGDGGRTSLLLQTASGGQIYLGRVRLSSTRTALLLSTIEAWLSANQLPSEM